MQDKVSSKVHHKKARQHSIPTPQEYQKILKPKEGVRKNTLTETGKNAKVDATKDNEEVDDNTDDNTKIKQAQQREHSP